MQQNNKKQYNKPRVTDHGSVEQVTGWVGGGCNEVMGGDQGSTWTCGFLGKKDLGS